MHLANDLEIRWGAARAAFDAGRPQGALQHLKVIAQTDINYRADEVGLLIAKAYAAQGDSAMGSATPAGSTESTRSPRPHLPAGTGTAAS